MSACGEFAEHVWKPGSCKNCFHPRSAHGQTGTAGGAGVQTSLIGEDEDGVTSPSLYSKPTIAVRPTMMNMDVTMEVKTDINMNTEQVTCLSNGCSAVNGGLLQMLTDGLECCGLLVDYCDVFISCLDSHSDGTHSLQSIHC
uniref:Uncharacterized protein n=1 Tax=Sinocyclocheilus anshuiensis TaxID=1608454 RepID=A0A671PUA9_9TELE